MLTTLSITSLHQGRALAHWYVDRLYAEPGEAIATDAAVEARPNDTVEVGPDAARPARRSWPARIRAILQTGYPFAQRHVQNGLTKP